MTAPLSICAFFTPEEFTLVLLALAFYEREMREGFAGALTPEGSYMFGGTYMATVKVRERLELLELRVKAIARGEGP